MKNGIVPGSYQWRFFRAGGFDQVRLDSGKDLAELENLDQKLWVALACPTDTVHFDSRTLSLIDTDGDKRVRATELLTAIRWTLSLLKNRDELVAPARTFSLQTISDAHEEGRNLIAVARNVLNALGKSESDTITVADIESVEKVLAAKPFNGDGVITEEAADDEKVRGVLREITASLGAVTDRSGKGGITKEKIDLFFTLAHDFNAWFSESEQDPAIRPLGKDTEEAAAAVLAVREKIDDYFARCAIARFDGRSIVSLSGGEKPFEALSGPLPISVDRSPVAGLPLAQVQPQDQLPVARGINPSWAEAMRKFDARALRPLIGPKETLAEHEWRNLLAAFTPWFAWQERKPAAIFNGAEIARIRELLQGELRATLLSLVEKDTQQKGTFDLLICLEKLVRFHRDLFPLCTNFVNFKDFYTKAGSAIFIAGTLYLDQRSCKLCIKVDDPNRHSLLAAMAGTYLAYCECRRRGKEERMTIVAAFTNGDSDNLMVGRNGVFYDRAGNDWDAHIIKIIENPISLRQAFWLPYKSLVRMIESQVAKRATAADSQSTSRLEQTASAAANIDKSKPDAVPKKLDIGVVAALGVAAGALGTFLATLMGYAAGIIRLGPFAIIGALLGVLMLISGPSIILAYIKLRKRNIGPILDANGWAINAKARINVPFGTVLTNIAALPPGAQRDLIDPYAERKSLWPKIVLFATLVYLAYFALDHLGFINEWTGGRIGMKSGQTKNTAVIKPPAEPAAPSSGP